MPGQVTGASVNQVITVALHGFPRTSPASSFPEVHMPEYAMLDILLLLPTGMIQYTTPSSILKMPEFSAAASMLI